MTGLLLLLFTQVVEVVETDHYQLHAEGEPALAAEYSRVLEAAYPQFEKFFGAKPRLKKKQKLVVRYFLTREAWAKAILADRAVPPAKAGGFYWPSTKTAYLYKQPTRYYSRALLIHEAAHQFHFLARTKNSTPSAVWYREGTAEYLAAHYWDGENLKLGVLPHVTLKDYAADALKQTKAPGFDLMKYVAGKTPESRPLGWALYRYLATQGGKSFPKWTKKMNSGGSATSTFKRGFKKKLRAGFVPWLEQHQEPFRQVWNEWQGAGNNSVRGFAGVVSVCQLKRDVTELSAVIVPPKSGRWTAGLLLHYKDKDDFTVAMLENGTVLYRDHVHTRLERIPLKAATLKIKAFRKDGKTYVSVGDETFGPWELEGGRFGFAIDNCDVRFDQVRWKR